MTSIEIRDPDINDLLEKASGGDGVAAAPLVQAVYQDFRRVAAA